MAAQLVLPFQEVHGLEDAQANFEAIVVADPLLSTNNLSDVASASTSRTNLGLGTAATRAANLFPNLPAGANNQILWGAISGAGAINGTSSGGFTVSKGTAGLYTLNWTTSFKDAGYSVVVTPIAGATAGITSGAQLVGSCGISTFLSGTLTNEFFTFIAFGAI